MSMPEKILYIEDDITNRILVRKLLHAEGYSVLEAEDGLAGIEMAKTESPDLILLDMNMPGIDGYETIDQIRGAENLNEITVIALTADAMAGDREKAIHAGCDGYISKPIDLDNFTEQIRDYLER